MEEYEKMAMDANAVGLISLNKKWYETDSYKDVREIDILEDKKGEDPTRRLQRKDLMRMVTKGLSRNERLIIILYYYEELTMKEIGATLDLSESRVSQMHSSIIQRLQSQLATAPARIRDLTGRGRGRIPASSTAGFLGDHTPRRVAGRSPPILRGVVFERLAPVPSRRVV